MVTRIRKPAAKSLITPIARYFVKRNAYVLYTYHASKKSQFAEQEPYVTTVITGKATNCTCPARQTYKRHLACKHMQDAQTREDARSLVNDKSYTQALAERDSRLDDAYEVRGAEIAEAGTLHRNREVVAPVGASSTEASMAARGWMR